jgi:electron transfer flavoprotein alpha subunit
LGHHGADVALVADEAFLASYSPRIQAFILKKIIDSHQPWLFLFGSTPYGREIAPALAAKVGASLVTDCSILDVDGADRLVMTKFIYGGQASAEIVCPDEEPQMATIQPGTVDIDEPDYSREAEVVTVDCGGIDAKPVDTQVIEFLKGNPKEIDISDAEILVAGGRGMANKGSFQLIEELADLIDGSVGGSRVAADKGWIPYSRQVGLSGKTTVPALFIACGISGAVQFLAGMKNSKNIIAINKDKYAPIFNIADLRVLGDVHKILPPLIERIREIKKEKNQG